MGEATEQHDYLIAALCDDHGQLEDLLCRLVGYARKGAQPETRDALKAFATHLVDHIEAEEQFVLARFAGAHLASAVRIRLEHTAIRERLSDLQVAAARNRLTETQLSEFASLLHVHAVAEERAMYRWSATALSPAQRHALLRRLGREPNDGHARLRWEVGGG